MKNYHYLLIIMALLVVGSLWWLSDRLHYQSTQYEHNENGEEIGPHKGRIFHKNGFSVELILFEKKSPPRFHVYIVSDGKPISSAEVKLNIQLIRLDGSIANITFIPGQDYLISNEAVKEPHSFDVKINAIYQNKLYAWTFPSYETRTRLSAQSAKDEGIRVETAGPGIIKKYVSLNGRITLNQNTTVDVRARFPGVVKEVFFKWGDVVKKGDLLATIESNESLKAYDVRSSTDGRILTRNISVGNVAGSEPLFTLVNLSDVWAELHVFPRDLGKINEGQMVTIHSQEDDRTVQAPITMLLPTTDPLSQTVIAIVAIANPDNVWRPGTIVRGDVLITERSVPILIKATAVQHYKDSTVVFITKGDQYQMQPVTLGETDSQWVEVTSGLTAGINYVTNNSFLLKADIEKSGAEHDH